MPSSKASTTSGRVPWLSICWGGSSESPTTLPSGRMTVNRVELRLPSSLQRASISAYFLGCQERNDLVLGQAGPGLEVLGRAGEVELPQRRRGVQRDHGQRHQRDQRAWPDKVARTSVVCA